MATSTTKNKFIFAVGRRKEAVARVRLYAGKGESLVNNQSFEKYFPGQVAQLAFEAPFRETGTLGKFFVTVRIVGGGKNGQLTALIHGLSRALSLADEKNRPALKKKGFLTRDARKKERRKVGTGGKARRKKQSPKR